MEILTGYVPIKNNDNLARDLFSKGVVNTNDAAYYRAKRLYAEAIKKKEEEQRQQAVEKERLDMMQDQLNSLSRDMAELRDNVRDIAGILLRLK